MSVLSGILLYYLLLSIYYYTTTTTTITTTTTTTSTTTILLHMCSDDINKVRFVLSVWKPPYLISTFRLVVQRLDSLTTQTWGMLEFRFCLM